jgi:hypothetical protein
MAEGQRPKRKALHRGIADIIPNKDASDTSRLLNKVQARPLRPEPAIEKGAESPTTQGTLSSQDTVTTQTTVAKNISEPLSKTTHSPQTTVATQDTVPVKAGHLWLPHHVSDVILPSIKPDAQVVLLRILRLSWGWGEERCIVGAPRLASSCHISETQVRRALKTLYHAGYIERVGVDDVNSQKSARGLVLRVLIPRRVSTQATPARQTTVATQAAIKESIKTKDNKKAVASLDTTKCPDCDGMGVRYIDPLDYSKGTVKCRHERLTEGK